MRGPFLRNEPGSEYDDLRRYLRDVVGNIKMAARGFGVLVYLGKHHKRFKF